MLALAKPDLRRTMRTTELVSITFVITGCAFKIMHWPGAAWLLILGGWSLALYYFPFGFRTLPAPRQTDQQPWLTWTAGLALFTVVNGLVFFMQRWPFSGPLMLGGVTACAVVVTVAAVVRYRHPRLDMYCDGLLLRCLILGLLAFFLWSNFMGKPR